MTTRFWHNERRLSAVSDNSLFTADAPARPFHQSIPGFSATHLVELPELARSLGLGRIFVKDESTRLNLKAFKVLGGAYAVAKLLAAQLDLDQNDLSLSKLKASVQQTMPNATLATATDGNHGKGVAWIATQLGLRSMIYLPAGTVPSRQQAIEDCGATTILTELNYDNTVLLAAAHAEEHGWFLIQDTAWPGYEQIPAWIMQGYTTLAAEASEQLELAGANITHLMLQAGVGSMAAALQYYWLKRNPIDFKTIIMEPEQADCFYRSACAGDGMAHTVEGELISIMAGLACGQPSPLAWPLLRDTASAFSSSPDNVAALGMRILANPLPKDPVVVSGGSGAIGIGLLAELAFRPELAADRKKLGLDDKSVVLVINTEGITDPDNYRRVVWGGESPLVLDFSR